MNQTINYELFFSLTWSITWFIKVIKFNFFISYIFCWFCFVMCFLSFCKVFICFFAFILHTQSNLFWHALGWELERIMVAVTILLYGSWSQLQWTTKGGKGFFFLEKYLVWMVANLITVVFFVKMWAHWLNCTYWHGISQLCLENMYFHFVLKFGVFIAKSFVKFSKNNK